MEGTKNIRRKVIAEFSSPADGPDQKRMFELMRAIDYELTGNEMVAKLAAHREVKKQMPEFNKKPKPANYTHAIYLDKDEHGFLGLKIHPVDWPNGEVIMRFSSKTVANKILEKILRENNLYAWFSVRSRMKGNEIDPKTLKNYNVHMEKAVKKYLYRQPNFFIISEGIHPEEHSAIWIENNLYKGFGYFNPELTQATPENLKEVIRAEEDDSETQKIIRSLLRKMKNLKIVAY